MSKNEPRFGDPHGQYSDGSPLDNVQYLECKLILRPDRFTAAKVFFDYGKLVARTAKEFGIGFINKGVTLKPEIREVLFLDTRGAIGSPSARPRPDSSTGSRVIRPKAMNENHGTIHER